MKNRLPPIYFYLSGDYWQRQMPETIHDYWRWLDTIDFSSYPLFYSVYDLVLQTYLYLKTIGFPCELVKEMPAEGIIIGHRYCFPDNLYPRPKTLVICILADKRTPHDRGLHPYAQIHVVQNPYEEKIICSSVYIPIWPQPNLIPRDINRGNKFENIAYMGQRGELAAELQDPAWSKKIRFLGLNWYILGEKIKWNDYSYIDAVVAVRSFTNKHKYSWKPASKLVNAWRAGVPAILGVESAYQAERRSELDYIEVKSTDEIIAALTQLRGDKVLYRAMIENGRSRSQEFNIDKILERWKFFLTEVASAAYEGWCAKTFWDRKMFILQHYPRYLYIKGNDFMRRLFRIFKKVL
ncbi:MAG: hypothetical protein NC828_01860 [Candidatus Omnitrophica bacterium]|nr:hypothetical protein [Candidatus Omnitrophota bacterium]